MEETAEQKRQAMAAIGAIMGQLIYSPKIKAAQEAGKTEEVNGLIRELGKFILDFVDKPTNEPHV